MSEIIHILGIDPGLQRMGWGIITVKGWQLGHLDHGVICSNHKASLSKRLKTLYDGLTDILDQYSPNGAAIETSFMQMNAQTALKLGHARAAAMLAVEKSGIPLSEYAPRVIKKAIVGTGQADKDQIANMLGVLLPGLKIQSGDASDALATAICHAHFLVSPQKSELIKSSENSYYKSSVSKRRSKKNL